MTSSSPRFSKISKEWSSKRTRLSDGKECDGDGQREFAVRTARGRSYEPGCGASEIPRLGAVQGYSHLVPEIPLGGVARTALRAAVGLMEGQTLKVTGSK